MKPAGCAMSFAALAAAPVSASAVPATLRFQPPAGASSVSVAGTFNGWSGSATPMVASDGGTFTVTLDLKPGPYQYKYVVDGRWQPDPGNPNVTEPDNNSVLWVTPDGGSSAHAVGDGRLLAFAVQAGEPFRIDAKSVRFRIETAADDVQRVSLNLGTAVVPMAKTGSNGLLDTWSVTAPVKAVRYHYGFTLTDGPNHWTYNAGGVGAARPFTLSVANMLLLKTPDWVRDTVWYQIFPERFNDGDTSNDFAPPKGVAGWDTPLTDVDNPNGHWWGGDLKGITAKLPYLKSLGITGLYLNPVFDGPDTHHYATTDYLKIAPEFGTEKDLKALCDAAHKDGMRVMLDGVFNHTSVYFFAFQDILKNQEASPYKNWYHIHSFPVLDPTTNYYGADERSIPYDGWYGHKWMPKLNTSNPATEKYLLKVATYWIERCGIDGWRLDAAEQVLPDTWRKFRVAVKHAKPDAYVMGEIWTNAAPWLQGDQFDAVMNYRFRASVLDFMSRGTSDAAKFARSLETLQSDYPPQATAAMFNLLGSHDTARLWNESGGDARRVQLATVFQMTYPGAPSIYYGDEIGMRGGNDPYDRAPMEWDQRRWNSGIAATVKKSVALRRSHPALRGSAMRALYAPAGGRVAAFLREGQGETAVTVFNASETTQNVTVPLGSAGRTPKWRDAWRGQTFSASNRSLTVSAPAMSAMILFPVH